MPILGFLAGDLLGQVLGEPADYVAAAVLVAAGRLMFSLAVLAWGRELW